MAYTEFHIDSRYRLYGRYYHTLSSTESCNPFLATHRAALNARNDAAITAQYEQWKKLDSLGILASDARDDKYIPLSFHLALPAGAAKKPHPLAVIIHGQARSFFEDGKPVSEVRSYRGYRYLQQYLAEHGIASVSVNANVANWLGGGGHADFEPQGRIHISFLVLAALAQLSNAPVTASQPIFFQKSDADNCLVPFQDGLALTPPFATGSPEALLAQLKADLRGKLSFTSLGFLGHARGGHSVQVLQPFFSPRVGTRPADDAAYGPTATTGISIQGGPYNANTLLDTGRQLLTIAPQYHAILDLASIFGSPGMDSLKTVVSVQPSSEFALLGSPSTFFLVLQSSHDDLREGSFNSYENVNSPKAMVYGHGASHRRFNTVWRQLDTIRTQINRTLICQSPLRMLSNAGHENLAKATAGNALIAGLTGRHHRYRLFTDELRSPLVQDISRSWKFPFPFASPPAIVLLDSRTLSATNLSTNATITVETRARLSDLRVGNQVVFANQAAVKRVSKPASQAVSVKIPIQPGDGLTAKSHFSFRYTKEYNGKDAKSRKAIQLRDYSITLKSGTKAIGVVVEGKDIPTQAQVAYPALQYDEQMNGCRDDTVIVMQTAELPLLKFLANQQPVTDLNQVNAIEIKLNEVPGGTGEETYFFVDFLLTSRALPAAPQGFQIP